MGSVDTLGTYLNDHLAGAEAGCELAERMSSEYTGTALGVFMAELAREVDEDRKTLENLINRLGVEKDLIKQAAGWMMEKFTRVKTSETFSGSKELKQLLSCETLSLGIEGKLALWRALREVRDQHAALDAVDLDGLAKRAQEQRAKLEEYRLDIAKKALGG